MPTGKTIALTKRTFVSKVMSLLFNILSRLVITFLFIIGNWNAKIGSQETPGVTGKFGLGIWNKAGQRLIEFFNQENALVIANTLFQQHSSKASILRSSTFFIVQLSHPYMTTGKTIALIDGPLLVK